MPTTNSARPGACVLPQPKKARRKRKPRYPKGYDPSLPGGGLPPPDPERWLPKWQRSESKKKLARRHRERQADTVKGSQGAGKVDDNLDRGARAERGEDAAGTAQGGATKPGGGGKAPPAGRPSLPARPAKAKGGRR